MLLNWVALGVCYLKISSMLSDRLLEPRTYRKDGSIICRRSGGVYKRGTFCDTGLGALAAQSRRGITRRSKLAPHLI